jgi:hypothetical protein
VEPHCEKLANLSANDQLLFQSSGPILKCQICQTSSNSKSLSENSKFNEADLVLENYRFSVHEEFLYSFLYLNWHNKEKRSTFLLLLFTIMVFINPVKDTFLF